MKDEPRLAPVAATERIVALDVLRGFALLGILLMNVEFFGRPLAELESGMATGLQGIDQAVAWFVHVFVRGKFWTLFSLLFGMGFAIMLLRADARGAPFAWPYLRRTIALALFGLGHFVYLWGGDILFSYAMGALMLLLLALPAGLRRAVPQRVAGIGMAIYMLPFLLMVAGGATMMAVPRPQPTAQEQQEAAKRLQAHQALVVAETAAMRDGSHADAVAFRVAGLPKFVGVGAGFGIIAFGVFLVGTWFVRSGVIVDPAANPEVFRAMARWGLGVGLGLSVVAALVATRNVPGSNDGRFLVAMGLASIGSLLASCGYIGAVVCGLQGRARRWLEWLAPAGRMALTNYLAQSLLGTAFFYGHGLGRWGVGQGGQLLFVLVLFALQVLASRWWLARFRHGPLEWAWRAVTYLRLPPMRRA